MEIGATRRDPSHQQDQTIKGEEPAYQDAKVK
jgi:hypothetical protein